jgi:putative flippase GtrA
MIEQIINKHGVLLKQMVLYGLIGTLSAAIDSSLFILLRYLHVEIFLSNFISVNAGITCSFFLNTYINFKMTDKLLKRALSFYAVGYLGLLLSMGILLVFATELKFNEIIVKIISVFVVAAFQFVLNKLITYRKKAYHG